MKQLQILEELKIFLSLNKPSLKIINDFKIRPPYRSVSVYEKLGLVHRCIEYWIRSIITFYCISPWGQDLHKVHRKSKNASISIHFACLPFSKVLTKIGHFFDFWKKQFWQLLKNASDELVSILKNFFPLRRSNYAPVKAFQLGLIF